MAIAFVAANSGTNSGVGNTLTLAIDAGAGADRGIIACVWLNANVAVNATYAGAAMTQVGNLKYSSTNETIRIYALSNPASGSNNLIFQGSGSIEMFGEGAVYTGCHQTTASLLTDIASTETGASTPITQSTTPTNANAWGIAGYGGQRNGTASTGVTARTGDGTQGVLGDSNGTITQGAPYSMSYTIASALRQLMIVGSLNPVPAVGPALVKTFDGVTQSTGIKTYMGVTTATTKSVNGIT